LQLKVLQQVDGSSYAPLKDLTIGGIIMVRHVKPGAAEELVEPVAGMYNKKKIIIYFNQDSGWRRMS
jgi:26S proteasome regulatory subunit N2